MEQNKNYIREEELEIDLIELFFVLLSKWHLLFLTGLLCALIGLLSSMFFMSEK